MSNKTQHNDDFYSLEGGVGGGVASLRKKKRNVAAFIV